jgi:hypothetical protein
MNDPTILPRSGPPGRDGSVLLIALFVSLVLMASAAAIVTNSLYRQAAERSRIEMDRAVHVAEAGLDVSFYEVQTATDLTNDSIGAASGPVAGGRYVATIAPAYAGPGTYTLTSVGTYGRRRQTVERVVTRPPNSSPGFVGVGQITLSGGASIDSFDSTLGTYASQLSGGHAGAQAGLATNGDVVTSGGGKIWGDAHPGPTGTYSGTVAVSGSTTPASQNVTTTPYAYAPPGVALTAWNGPGTLTAGTYHYTQLTVSGGGVLFLSGDVTIYCDNKFTVGAASSIRMLPGARVTIHHGSNDVTIGGGGIVNQDAKASTLAIHSASTTKVVLSGSAAFYGSVDAQSADLTSSGAAGMYGAAVAKTITLNSPTGWLHQDRALDVGGVGGFEIAMERGW